MLNVKKLFTSALKFAVKDVPGYYFDATAESGTLDSDLYASITALGWESEVIR